MKEKDFGFQILLVLFDFRPMINEVYNNIPILIFPVSGDIFIYYFGYTSPVYSGRVGYNEAPRHFCFINTIKVSKDVTNLFTFAAIAQSNFKHIIIDNNNLNFSSLDGNLYNKNKTTLVRYAIGRTATSFTIPNSVTTIGGYSFSDCTALSSITIPNSVTTIGSYAFSDCTALSSIAISNSVTIISEYAFRNCTALSSITIPNSVTTIGDYAFYNWTNTQKIRIEAASKPAGWNSDWYRNSSAKIVLSNYNLPEITIENLSKGSTLDYKSSEPGAYGLTVGSMQNNYIANHKYYQRAFAKYTTTNQKPKQMTLYAQNGWQTIKQAYSPTANVEYYLSGFTISNSACLDNKNHNIYCEPSNAIDGVTTHGKQSMTFDLDAPTNNGKSLNNYFDNAGYTTDAEKLSILDLLPYFAETFTFSGR